MPLQVGDAFRRGFDTLMARTGVMLALVFSAVNLVFLGGPLAVIGSTRNPAAAFSLGISGLIGAIVSTVVIVVALRTFMADERRSIPEAFYRRQLGLATINLLLGQIVAAVLIGLGFVLVIPGLYLLVSLVFWQIFVAVENEDFIDAFRSSWALSTGNRWSILILVFGILVAVIATQAVSAMFSSVLPFIGPLVGAVLSGILAVYVLGVIVAAYRQLQM